MSRDISSFENISKERRISRTNEFTRKSGYFHSFELPVLLFFINEQKDIDSDIMQQRKLLYFLPRLTSLLTSIKLNDLHFYLICLLKFCFHFFDLIFLYQFLIS